MKAQTGKATCLIFIWVARESTMWLYSQTHSRRTMRSRLLCAQPWGWIGPVRNVPGQGLAINNNNVWDSLLGCFLLCALNTFQQPQTFGKRNAHKLYMSCALGKNERVYSHLGQKERRDCCFSVESGGVGWLPGWPGRSYGNTPAPGYLDVWYLEG